MPDHSHRIEPTEFGVIADCLRHPAIPVFVIVHVRDAATMGRLAAQADRELPPDGCVPHRVVTWLNQLVAQGEVLISPRQLAPGSDRTFVVPVADIPRHALTYVILTPPFYFAHTPGLFEGTLLRPKPEQNPADDLRPHRAPRRKM